MPTYDYKCTACRHTMEAFQSMKDKPLRKCPACGKNTLERQIGTGAAVLFKGSGFYQTDYRSESYKKAAASEKSNGSSSSSSSSSESPSKPEPAKNGGSAPAAKADPKPAPKKSGAKGD